jgi:hypothetical protein
MKENNNEFSFEKGWMQRRAMDETSMKEDIKNVFGIKNETSWTWRLYGRIEPKVSEKAAVDAVFEKYGITENVWGLINETEVAELNLKS